MAAARRRWDPLPLTLYGRQVTPIVVQNQTATAVARTVPLVGLVYALILLWYAARVRQGRAAGWRVRP